MFSSKTYMDRRYKLRQKLGSGLVLLLGNNEASINFPDNHYRFRQDSSFLYFVGLNKPGLAAMLDISEDTDWLVGREMTIDDIIWGGQLPSLSELAESAGISSIMSPEELKVKIKAAVNGGHTIHILPPYRAEQRENWSSLFEMEWASIKHYYVSEELIQAIVGLRNNKSEEEVEEIHKACNITGAMHLGAMKYARPGMIESQVAGHVNGIAVSGGGDLSFPIILSTNGQILHNHYHGNVLKKGKLLLVDCGAETAMGYAGDMTRTFPVDKSFTSKQKSIYEIVLAAQMHAISLLKPGISNREVHLEACKVIATGLKDLGILKGAVDDIVIEGAHALFMPHGLGHMMGLDVHDMEDLGEELVGYGEEAKSDQFGLRSLRLGRVLEPGFVLTIEPGIYFIPELANKWKNEGPHKKFISYNALSDWFDFGGIRIEEDLLITPEGSQLLGDPVAKTVSEIEEIRKEALS